MRVSIVWWWRIQDWLDPAGADRRAARRMAAGMERLRRAALASTMSAAEASAAAARIAAAMQVATSGTVTGDRGSRTGTYTPEGDNDPDPDDRA